MDLLLLFRVYPKNLEKRFDIKNFAKEQYKREFEDAEYKDDLKKYNNYQFKSIERNFKK